MPKYVYHLQVAANICKGESAQKFTIIPTFSENA